MNEAIGGPQALSAAVSLASWALSRAGNAPQSVQRCLQLVEQIHGSLQHLIALRDENLARLVATPQELGRVNAVIDAAAETITDVGLLLEKYRPDADLGRASLKARIVWVVTDAESFSLCAPNLLIQHATVLSEINYLESWDPRLRMADRAERTEPQRRFENVGLLQSILGGGRVVPRPLETSTSPPNTISPPPSLSPAPAYSAVGPSRQRAASNTSGSFYLNPQPSVQSLVSMPPPYSPSEELPIPLDTLDDGRRSRLLAAQTGLARPSTAPSNDGGAQRTAIVNSPFVGLKALFADTSEPLKATVNSGPLPDRHSWYPPKPQDEKLKDVEPRRSLQPQPSAWSLQSTSNLSQVTLVDSTGSPRVSDARSVRSIPSTAFPPVTAMAPSSPGITRHSTGSPTMASQVSLPLVSETSVASLRQQQQQPDTHELPASPYASRSGGSSFSQPSLGLPRPAAPTPLSLLFQTNNTPPQPRPHVYVPELGSGSEKAPADISELPGSPLKRLPQVYELDNTSISRPAPPSPPVTSTAAGFQAYSPPMGSRSAPVPSPDAYVPFRERFLQRTTSAEDAAATTHPTDDDQDRGENHVDAQNKQQQQQQQQQRPLPEKLLPGATWYQSSQMFHPNLDARPMNRHMPP